MVYTLRERIEIVNLYYQNGDSARAAARMFNDRHRGINVRHKYVSESLNKFMETGSANNKKHNHSGDVNDEAIRTAVLGHGGLMEYSQYLTKLSRESGISHTNVSRIPHKYKLYPHKIRLVHELNEDDIDRRIGFCKSLTELINLHLIFLYKICFSDESTFSLNGEVNRQNCRYWSETNSHLYRQVHTQHHVWAGILGDHIIGLFIIHDNLTSDKYLDMLENRIILRINRAIEEDINLFENEIVFQQDGAPPHYAATVRQFLDNHFSGCWIGRRDLFLWGYLKSKVYEIESTTSEDFRENIMWHCREITSETLNHVRPAMEARLNHCMGVGGNIFEYYFRFFFSLSSHQILIQEFIKKFFF